MGLYQVDNSTWIDTDVRHRWDCDQAGIVQTVCWIEGDGFVNEVLAQMGGDAYVSPLPTEDAHAMLARYGHGPDPWTCACSPCRCERCDTSWHTHGERCDPALGQDH
jgi:hypothetical protein